MKHTTKRIATLFLTAILTFTLASCTDKPEQLNPEPTADLNQQIAHYEALIKELEAELLINKEENYIAASEYKLYISDLENRISELSDKLASFTANTTQTAERPTAIANRNEFTYNITASGVTVTGYTGNDSEIEIPSQIDGVPTTSIGEEAFANCTATEITLPDTIITIDWFAFLNCHNLQKVRIPSSVEKIGYGAFDNCAPSLTVICPADSYAHAFAASFGIPTLES